MNIEYTSIDLEKLLREETRCNSLCELGAGIFRFFHLYNTTGPKIGIELISSYIANREYKDCIPINGDALDFEDLLDGVGYPFVDVMLLIDFIEHLDKDIGLDLIERIKSRCNKILIFTPLGYEPQNGVSSWHFFKPQVKTTTSVEERARAIDAQVHRSGWFPEDFSGFTKIMVDKDRANGPDFIFAIWNK